MSHLQCIKSALNMWDYREKSFLWQCSIGWKNLIITRESMNRFGGFQLHFWNDLCHPVHLESQYAWTSCKDKLIYQRKKHQMEAINMMDVTV